MLSSFASGALFGQRVGEGRPRVLALHGWGGNAQQLLPALGNLAGISLDLPGFGRTPPPPTPWGARDYADAIAPVLAEFDAPPVVLGFSFGGRIAVQLGAHHASGIERLVLTGAPLLRARVSPSPSRSFRLLRWAHRRGLVSDARMEQERQKRGSSDYRAASGVMRDILVRSVNETYEAELANQQRPVHFVWGAQDTAAPLWIVEAAAKLLPKGLSTDRTVTDEADHFLPLTHPAVLTAALQ